MESDICLLCLEHKERLKVPSKVFETTVINTIALHFWFAPEDAEKHLVCNDCWQQVDEFDKFYKKVEMIHRTNRIAASANCTKSSASVHQEPEVGRCTTWNKEFDTEQSHDKFSSDYDAVLVEEEESQIDQLDDEDDFDLEDKADDNTSIEVHENAWLKISVLNVPTKSFYEEHSHSEHSFELTDADDSTSDSESEKLLNKYGEPASSTAKQTHAPESELYICQTYSKNLPDHESRSDIEKGLVSDLEIVILTKGPADSAKFCSEKTLEQHYLATHVPGDLICDTYSEGRSQFGVHQNAHQGGAESQTRVECNLCGKWLKNSGSLRKHTLRHKSSSEPQICDICGKRAPNSLALQSHKTFVHRKEKSFKCTVCQKAFKRAFTLQEYMTMHTGDILYQCLYCPKLFNSSANMHAHRKGMHPAEWKQGRRQNHKDPSQVGC
ncbi:transcription factor grauzone-like [Anopheles cruzii]|uniref:transcription factor grauzone-like n=1 Tax=Anopheles cruzii TaxID=68878 RepID=UPI0022EC3E16|nr:transcription factor grauzone-like [Anopheles cruzii]